MLTLRRTLASNSCRRYFTRAGPFWSSATSRLHRYRNISSSVACAMSAEKKVVIIFGGGGAVGKSLSKCLHDKKDVKLVVVDRDEKHLKEVEAKLPDVHTMCKDAHDIFQVRDVLNMHRNERIRAVVNLIGDLHVRPFQTETAEELLDEIHKNVVPAFNILREACQALKDQGGGAIVAVSAAVAHHGIRNHEAWAAAKGAVEAMHLSAAADYAAFNVRINCVAPGLIRSQEAHDAGLLGPRNVELQRFVDIYPMKRIAEPSEVANVIEFLALGHGAEYITGQTIAIDGGLTTLTPRTHHRRAMEVIGHAAEPAGPVSRK